MHDLIMQLLVSNMCNKNYDIHVEYVAMNGSGWNKLTKKTQTCLNGYITMIMYLLHVFL